MGNNKLRNRAFCSILTMIVCILFGCEKKDTLVLSQIQEVEAKVQEEESCETDLEPEVQKIVVHICGAVVRPGVYEFPEGDRICQAVEAAGGFTKEADEELLNQAQKLVDGMQLVIPTQEEARQALAKETGNQSFLRYEGKTSSGDYGNVEEDGLININTASEEMLCTLPGIGSEKAKSIIDYRIQNGSYQRIEDIMNVSGIKEGMFTKIKDRITV